MTPLIPVAGFHPEDWMEFTLRLTISLVSGGAIGWERQSSGKAAGLRTHALVSLGTALFIMVPLSLSSSATPDSISRAIQGIATGIGFLGAGEIVQQHRDSGKPHVYGLTSAASIWVTAALGALAACGLWQICLIGTSMTLAVLLGEKRGEGGLTLRQRIKKSKE
ncbi:MgtC/SapB family protein [Leptolyngbyaceae cyanobacterium UHCC 1019]